MVVVGVWVTLLLASQPPVAVASGPGVNEYTLNIPGPGHSGNHPTQGDVQSNPSALPPGTAADLSQSSDGALLGAIATDPALGAPSSGRHGGPGGGSSAAGGGPSAANEIGRTLSRFAAGNDGRSVPASLASAAGDHSALPLLLAVAAITVIAGALVVRRRRLTFREG